MINHLINYFIPPNLVNKTYTYYRTFAFVCLILFINVSALVMQTIVITMGLENDPNLILGVLLLSSILFITKKFGNLVLSGNLMTVLIFGVLATTVPHSGGLYSDNLIWMIICPMVALLFTNKKSGFIWLLILLGFVEYQYYQFEKTSGINNLKPTDSTYYFISFFLLFIFVYGIISIFEKGQALIISVLSEQKIQLEMQQHEIIQKNAELQVMFGELQTIEEKLRLSNQELENFAFVASHDMKEPLRMIGMYTQLVRKKLSTHLDNSSLEYMNYVTDGVSRMQNLLNDLLQYSRLNKEQKDIKQVNLNNTLAVVKHNLQILINETDTQILSNQLPTIRASISEMSQLFQNLISNSIKFRKKGIPPLIEICVSEEEEIYLFSFKDNGIGIEKEYQARVFNVFEKLHNHQEYEGSGIGLATCRKIVQNLGGTIWIDSPYGQGTTFYFTFAKDKNTVIQTNISQMTIEKTHLALAAA